MTSAGEVEQFAYCAHNWWLARHGVDPHAKDSQLGMEAHRELGAAQAQIEDEKREYRRALVWFFRLVAFACSATVLTLEVVYLRSFSHIVLLVTATGILVAGAASLLLLAIINERRYKQRQGASGIIPGRLAASDLGGTGPLLHDPEWNLHGRPDYVLETKSGFVPVEVKNARTPQRPHANHRLQLACYLRLIEVKTGKPPEYGLLNYPEGVFRVAWDDALRTELKGTLDRIGAARASGIADRDHQHAGRCIGCARREDCKQRLA
ncbi:MAG: Dna2/Cas4 domain-containing protein [Candidatus Thermoplasmatota archaeon]